MIFSLIFLYMLSHCDQFSWWMFHCKIGKKFWNDPTDPTITSSRASTIQPGIEDDDAMTLAFEMVTTQVEMCQNAPEKTLDVGNSYGSPI